MVGFNISSLFSYLGIESAKFIFLAYLCFEICVVSTIFYIQYKFCSIKFESSFLKLCQLIANSIYLPVILYISVNTICDRDNFFLQYVDDYFINIIINFKRISVVWMCWLGIAKTITNIEKALNENRGDANKSLIETIVRILKFFAYFILIMMILNLFGFSFVEFIKKSGGSVGIITTGIMFVWRQQLTNIFSGFTILINKNFRVGNKIFLPDKNIKGKVLDIGLNKVKILLDDQRVVTYPNSLLNGATYINLNECKNTLSKDVIYLQHIDYEKISIITEEIKNLLVDYKEINKSLPLNVYCNEILQNSALVIHIDYFINFTDTGKIKKLKQEILMNSIDICMKNNCHIFEQID